MRRTIEISTRGLHLSLKQNLLHIWEKDQLKGKVSFEDLGVLVLDSTSLTITTAAISAILGSNAAIVFCNGKHLPEGMLVAHSGNTLMAERLRAQVAASKPLHKNIWQQIVKSKINCQATLLPAGVERTRLLALAKKVNLEAQAARFYWPALLGGQFRRDRFGEEENPLLNYGYIVIRAAMARALSATGLNTALGVHHSNKYNAHCLADDLMEPYRVWLDARIKKLSPIELEQLDKNTKASLLEVLTDKVVINNEEKPLLAAIEDTAQSLSKIFLLAHNSETPISAQKLARQLNLPNQYFNLN